MLNGQNCSSPINAGKYIEDFECENKNTDDRKLKEMRLSFPSGHSSFSAYTMFYCAVSLGYFLSYFKLENVRIFFSDLFTSPNELGRFKVPQALFAVRADPHSLVHCTESHF